MFRSSVSDLAGILWQDREDPSTREGLSAVSLKLGDCDLDSTIARFGQNIVGTQIRWYCSGTDADGIAYESDDIGFPPESIRKYLLNQDGYWAVKLNDLPNRLETILLLSSKLKWPKSLVLEKINRSAEAFYVGTLKEAEWIKLLVESAGGKAKVFSVDPE